MATIIGCSSLPKVALSYKWIISDAEVLLKNNSMGLRSPEFSIPLQSTTEPASWSLLISRYRSNWGQQPSGGLLQGGGGFQLGGGGGLQLRASTTPSNPTSPPVYYELSLDSQHIQQQRDRCFIKLYQTVLISDCVFSILNSETGEQLHSIKPCQDNSKCSIDDSLKQCVKVKLFDDYELSKYLFNDTLIIQVSATLLCISSPTKTTLRVECDVPPDNVRGDMLKLYRDKALVDASIKCGNQVFKVHKAILASQSPVFRKMFEVDMKEKRSGVIEISDPDVSPEVVSDLVTYLYTGNAPGIQKQANELLKVAHLYEIPRLLKMSENELQKSITPDNVCNLLLLAELHAAHALKAKCMEFVHLNSGSVCKTPGWQEMKDKAPGLLCEVLEYCYYEKTT